MTAVSYTGTINTQGEFATVESLTSLTLTNGKSYTIQIQNLAFLKVANAEFVLNNQIFTWTQSSDDLYVKTNGEATITILENA